MGVLFSRVTAVCEYDATVFLVTGIPSSQEDLDGWKAVGSFAGQLDENDRVVVHIETFVYGEGPVYDATPEEIAYFYMRTEKRPDFIEARTKKIYEKEFSFWLRK